MNKRRLLYFAVVALVVFGFLIYSCDYSLSREWEDRVTKSKSIIEDRTGYYSDVNKTKLILQALYEWDRKIVFLEDEYRSRTEIDDYILELIRNGFPWTAVNVQQGDSAIYANKHVRWSAFYTILDINNGRFDWSCVNDTEGKSITLLDSDTGRIAYYCFYE